MVLSRPAKINTRLAQYSSVESTLASRGAPRGYRSDFGSSKFSYNRNPFRCQPITVSGFTIIRAERHFDRNRDSKTQKARSRGRSRGLWLRFAIYLVKSCEWLRTYSPFRTTPDVKEIPAHLTHSKVEVMCPAAHSQWSR